MATIKTSSAQLSGAQVCGDGDVIASRQPFDRLRPRLLIVVTRMDLGGVPEHIMILLGHISSDYDVTVACRDVLPKHRQRLESAGVRIHLIDLARAPNPLRDLRALAQLAAYIRREGFDIVHSHMSKGVLIGSLAARLGGAPLVLCTAHNFGWLALTNKLARQVFRLYDAALYSATVDRLITVSRLQEDQIVAAGLIPRTRVTTIFNGVDPARLRDLAARGASRSDLGVPEDCLMIVTVARLVWFKAIDQLIHAVAELGERGKRCRFVIVGDGDKREALAALTKRLGVEDRVVLLGPRLDVPRLLALADVFALPSVSEGMPIAIMEAMAFGLPVVATAVDGTPEVVFNGETGILVPPRSPARLAQALAALIEDAALRKKLGENGRARVEREFTDRAMARRVDELYRGLLAAVRSEPRFAT